MGLKALSRRISAAPDYETGSWTPTLGVVSGTDGSHTYQTQFGEYVRIGSVVWFKCTVDLATFDQTMFGAVTIKGLPFAATSNATPVSIANLQNVVLNTAGGYSMFSALIRDSQSDIALRQLGHGVPESTITHAAIGANLVVALAGVYRTG